LNLSEEEPVTVCVEEDGTLVEDDEVVLAYKVILASAQEWMPPSLSTVIFPQPADAEQHPSTSTSSAGELQSQNQPVAATSAASSGMLRICMHFMIHVCDSIFQTHNLLCAN